MTIFFLVTGTHSAAQTGCDSILWSAAKKLIPADFKDAADTGRTMIAFTSTKFAYKVFPQDGSAIIHSSAYFFPCSSWLNLANIKNSIAHEQLHFDIAEYHRRLFIQRISETKVSENMFASTTRNIFRGVAEQRRTMNIMYDQETRDGENEVDQSKWMVKIADLLTGLEKYSNNTTSIILK